ncbi:MAG: PfkB family carbohydrate kinase [Actinomycetota bacterium]|nr:PfkB family carbohydrate kinase [Actinomycetota bacterium]
MRVGVVGHVEWIDFVRVRRVPEAGEIVQAEETWGEPAGGGAVAAAQLARLAGRSTLFTALGDDEFGRRSHERLSKLGIRVEAAWREEPQRRGFTYVDADGERTITLLTGKLRPRGSDPLPWCDLASFDAVYFTGGDADAVRAARAARVLVATPRELPTLAEAGVRLDALVGSATDPAELYAAGDLEPPPRLVFRTEGRRGGFYEPGHVRWEAQPLPGEPADTYGAGDSFAACLTFALGERQLPSDAAELAAACAAEALTRDGAHGIR